MLMLMLAAASALVVNYSAHRLAIVVLVLGSGAMLSGLTIATFAAAATADPIDEVRKGMRRVEQGDFAGHVPVFDTTELGQLQAGFNTMVDGLRQRELLRDLFGRHVGRDVAARAERTISEGRDIELGGIKCEVTVMFVDIAGSTHMATALEPHDLVALLNEFFAEVVAAVSRFGGMINKFEGDAALAIFGAPVENHDHASHALAAARALHRRLRRPQMKFSVGIGVSAGEVVAGNVVTQPGSNTP